METAERHQPLVGRCLCGKYEVSLTASPEKRKVFACRECKIISAALAKRED
jgi:hypothetical protein